MQTKQCCIYAVFGVSQIPIITVKGKEIAEKELIRLRELVGIASGIVGGTL